MFVSRPIATLFALTWLSFNGATCGCSSRGAGALSTPALDADASVSSPAPSVTDSSPAPSVTDPLAFSALRLHFAIPFVDDAEALFPPLCPTGDDCFHSISVFADGHIALDDNAGRVVAVLTEAEAERVRELLSSEILRMTLKGPITDCPGMPADADIYIATTVRRNDDTEVVFTDAQGCVAGELTGRTDHPLYLLRVLMNDELRWRYAGCSGTDPAALDAADDASRRPLCRVGSNSIVTR